MKFIKYDDKHASDYIKQNEEEAGGERKKKRIEIWILSWKMNWEIFIYFPV